jgi:hypothetical protein
MKKPGLVAFGAFLVVIGAIWFAQGLGWIGGGAMSGETVWAVVGPVVALAGVGLVVFGVRARNTKV